MRPAMNVHPFEREYNQGLTGMGAPPPVPGANLMKMSLRNSRDPQLKK